MYVVLFVFRFMTDKQGLHNFTGEFVYRLLRPDEDPYKDIVCKDPNSNHSISLHVKEGLKVPTRFISTSASFSAAKDWISTSHASLPSEYSHLELRNTIVKISVEYIKNRYPAVAQSAYDFTDESVRSKYLVGVQRGYARRYEEIDFEKRIPKEAITDIYVVGKEWIGTVKPTASPRVPAITTPAKPVTNSAISPLTRSASTPISSPPLVQSRQSLSETICNTVSNVIDLSVTDSSQSITPLLHASAYLSGASTLSTFPFTNEVVKGGTGVKRKLPYETPKTPLKYKCNVQVDHLENVSNTCILGGERDSITLGEEKYLFRYNSVISPLTSSTSTPAESLLLTYPLLELSTQSLSATARNLIGSSLIEKSLSISSQLNTSSDLSVSKTGVKRKLSFEDPEPPMKYTSQEDEAIKDQIPTSPYNSADSSPQSQSECDLL